HPVAEAQVDVAILRRRWRGDTGSESEGKRQVADKSEHRLLPVCYSAARTSGGGALSASSVRARLSPSGSASAAVRARATGAAALLSPTASAGWMTAAKMRA